MENYAIDRDRVIVTGYSMGGMGTWYLASRHPGRFAAAIPMASAPKSADLEAIAKLPLYAIHSRADTLVALSPTARAIAELKHAGAPAELVIVTDVPHFESFRFKEYLAQAVDWLEKVWSRQ